MTGREGEAMKGRGRAALSSLERAKRDFQEKVMLLKFRKGWTNKDLADVLEVEEVTASRLCSNPLSASGKNIFMVEALFAEVDE